MKSLEQNAVRKILNAHDNRARNRIIGDTISEWLKNLKIDHNSAPTRGIIDTSDFECRSDFITDYKRNAYFTIAKCPECDAELTTQEAFDSFTNDPHNTRLICPNCDFEFQPMLKDLEDDLYMFLCQEQTVTSLLTIAAVYTRHKFISISLQDYPHIGHNMKIHFGDFHEETHQQLFDQFVEIAEPIKNRIKPYIYAHTEEVTCARYQFNRK